MAGSVLSYLNGETQAGNSVSLPSEFDNGSQAGPTYTLDWNDGQNQLITLTGNITTLTLTAPSAGVGKFLLRVVQGGAGSFTITWPGTVLWPLGTAPTLSIGVGDVDIVTMYWNGTNYYAVASLNFS